MTLVRVVETKEPETPEEYAEVLSNMTLGEASVILSLSGLADTNEEFEDGLQNLLDRSGKIISDPDLLRELFPEKFNE